MLSFEEFKNAVRGELKNYMPSDYADHRLVETRIHKINRCVDTFRLQPPGPVNELGPMPTLNYQDLYQSIVGGAKLEKVLLFIAQTLQYTLPMEADSLYRTIAEESKPDPSSLHVALINRERNREFLENVPHHDFLDLSAIAVLEGSLGSSYRCIVNNEMLKELDMDVDTLLKTACDNTFREYPSVLEQSRLGLNAWCEGSSFGAVCLLDQDMLKEAADILDSDLYVLPDSLHLLFIISAKDVPRKVVLESFARATLLEPDAFDFLSEHVYYYSRKDAALRILKEKTRPLS